MFSATFVLSTGRCGTQWLTEALTAAGGRRARVVHEPLHNDYAPRRMLGANDPAALAPRQTKKVLAHVDAIERELATHDYIETGHPCWSSLPWLAKRFPGRLRIVHLVRHPVPTACSWLSHGAFVPPPLPHVPLKELIAPGDAGVSFPGYGERWAMMTPLEKSLYYWAEVNAFGLRLERDGGLPWLRLRYEDLFGGGDAALVRLLAFLGWPPEMAARIDRGERVDQHRFLLAERPELERLAHHPGIAQLAGQFGYRLDEFPADQLTQRFLLPGR